MQKIPIFIGFSINPEIIYSFDTSSEENKIPLDDLGAVLGGSGFNTATALSKLGVENIFFNGLTGGAGNPFRSLLDTLLLQTPFEYSLIDSLDDLSIAILQLSTSNESENKIHRVIGRRGNVKKDFVDFAIDEVRKNKKLHNPKFRLALGVQSDEIDITEALFEDRENKTNVLVLNSNALKSTRNLETLLSLTDFAFMSNYEYRMLLAKNSELDLDGLHRLGIKLVVVTNSSHGGQFSFQCNNQSFRDHYPALKNSDCVSEVGAGDWFLAGFIAKMIRSGASDPLLISIDDIKTWIHFASLVSGLKVGYFGGSNGPTASELKTYGF